ncbi:hypothetical protein [Arthrobacter castelli]|uniref:hypothetical protein n=1 Tax=Arthrobacter castelli TaxID=271431 RepID=UPI00041F620D|nr:hypothetical protein [Arthrobacter castelli]
MYAIARLNSFDPTKLSASPDSLEEFNRLHSTQQGFLSSVVIDLQQGRQLVLNLWESEQHAASGLSLLGPEVGRLLEPLMVEPSEFLGAGTVISTELLPFNED